MVYDQIIARGIKHHDIIEAMLKIDRKLFISEVQQKHAYKDCPLPIGYGQTISQPYIVAYMMEQLELTSQKTILEIGTGCGYQTALLAEICRRVYTMEILSPLLHQAQQRLSKQGYTNIWYKNTDGYNGWKEYAPYDAIIVSASPHHTPQQLIEQLADKGRMIIPIKSHSQQHLIQYTKSCDQITHKELIAVRFVPLIHQTE